MQPKIIPFGNEPIKPKTVSFGSTPTKSIAPQPYSGIGSSVTNFGKDIAQGGYLATGGQQNIDDVSSQYMNNGYKLVELAKKQTDLNKRKQLLQQADQMFSDAQGVGKDVIGETRSPKQISGDALGTLGWATVAGTPTALGGSTLPATSGLGKLVGASKAVSSVPGRLALGTLFGAGSGAQQALNENAGAGEIAKKIAIGGATGLAVTGVMEGIGYGLRKLAESRAANKFAGNIYNTELQPDTKDMVSDLKRHFSSVGEQIANESDEAGNAVYKGGYDTMAKQAESQISEKAQLIRKPLEAYDKFDPVTIKAQDFKEPLLAKLNDEFGYLDDHQLASVEAELKKLPPEMNRIDLLDNRQIVDSKIPKGFWIDPNPQRSFIGNVRYYLRGIMKNAIEDSAQDVAVKQLNQKIGLAADVKDLAYTQEALRMKMRGVSSIGFWKPISTLLDRTVFSPQVTTRVAQGIKGLGQRKGGVPLENIITNLINQSQK